MKPRKGERRFVCVWVGALAIAGLLLAVSVASGPVAAAPPKAGFVRQYLLGTDPLCDLARTACPVISRAENGDTIELAGQGTFRPSTKAADGDGTFVHKRHGRVLGSGTWEATRMISFMTYGSGSLQGFPPEFEGGLVVMSVHVRAANGMEFDAILAVDCLLGTPPAGAEEGATLTTDFIDFNEKISGLTLFIMET